MATTSEVKAGLDAIAQDIAAEQAVIEKAQTNAGGAAAALGNLPTTYADLISTVNAYTPTGAFQTLAKDELAKLTSEYQALKTKAETIRDQT